MILDGWGYCSGEWYNAAALARHLIWMLTVRANIRIRLSCSGAAVGLPDGQMGNSKSVADIGTRAYCLSGADKITKAIKDGDFFENTVLSKATDHKANGNCLTAQVLFDGGVHSHISHLFLLY